MVLAGLFDVHAFGRGLLAGAIALLASAVIALVLRRGKRPGVLGVPIAVAALIAVRAQLHYPGAVPVLVFAALGLLTIGGLVAPRISSWPSMLAYGPGSVLLVFASVPGLAIGTRIAVGALTWGAAIVLADFEKEHARDGFALLLLPVAAIVPAHLVSGGTDPGAVLFGALIVVVVAALPQPRVRFGAAGTACLAASYFWIVALVADNRPARVAAAAGGLGFLLFEPLSRFLTRPVPHQSRKRRSKQLDDSRAIVVVVALLGQAAIALFVITVTAREASDVAMFTLVPIGVAATLLARAFVPSPRRWGKARQADRV